MEWEESRPVCEKQAFQSLGFVGHDLSDLRACEMNMSDYSNVLAIQTFRTHQHPPAFSLLSKSRISSNACS